MSILEGYLSYKNSIRDMTMVKFEICLDMSVQWVCFLKYLFRFQCLFYWTLFHGMHILWGKVVHDSPRISLYDTYLPLLMKTKEMHMLKPKKYYTMKWS